MTAENILAFLGCCAVLLVIVGIVELVKWYQRWYF